jgi:hypothetical protein
VSECHNNTDDDDNKRDTNYDDDDNTYDCGDCRRGGVTLGGRDTYTTFWHCLKNTLRKEQRQNSVIAKIGT